MSTYSSHLLSSYATDLIGYWQLNDASGNFADSSSNGFTATANGSPTYRNASLLPSDGGSTANGCVGLSGGAYGSIANNAAFHSLASFSIVAWAQPGLPATLSTACALFQRLSSFGLLISAHSTQVLMSMYGIGGSTPTPQSANDTVAPNCVSMLAITYDTAYLRTYLNGIQQAVVANTGTTPAGTTTQGIGASGTGTNPYTGRLQHVSLWGAASGFGGNIGQPAIQDLYVTGVTGSYPGTAGATFQAYAYPWSVQAVRANSGRNRVTLTNDSDAIIWASLGSTAAVGSGIMLLPNGGMITISDYTGVISTIHGWTQGYKSLCVLEE